MSSSGRGSNASRSSDAALAEFVNESNLRNQAQLDTLWRRIIATMNEVGEPSANVLEIAQSARHLTRPVRPVARLNSERASVQLPTPPEGSQFVPSTTDLSPAPASPPRSRRRLTRETRRRVPTSTSLAALLANRPHLTQLISPQAAAWLEQQGNELSGEGQQSDGEPQEFEPPLIRGPIISFDDISHSDVDDIVESDADATRWVEEGFSGYEEWYAHTFLGGSVRRPLDEDERLSRVARLLNTTPPTAGVCGRASVIVRQPWNADIAWSPFIYQQPTPNSILGDIRETYQSIKHNTLLEAFRERSSLYSVHSLIGELPLGFLSTNDDYESGSSNPSNMLRTNSAAYITTDTSNVNVELRFESGRHCVIERIFVQSAFLKPRCTEVMVLASSRRCNLDELKKYDGFTFSHYEQLAHLIKSQSGHLPDPLPIAYFWLSFEDNYSQIQVLSRGISCKYLYVKMLRGARAGQKMGLRSLRVFGWSGVRPFAETALC
ncbi:hypothetical protein GGI20_000614 [Coemansia sp. BCRC 34301]|nr:hypothetical protein GGI20_000614 [Coemansia sp. BCRC 34301]